MDHTHVDPAQLHRSEGGNTPKPRVLLSTAPMLVSPPEWAMKVTAEAGYTGCEILLGHNPESRDPQKVLGYAHAYGLDVPVVHGPYMVMLRGVLGTNYRSKTLAALDIAADIGAQTMVAHAPMRWERAARRWLATKQVDHEAAARGLQFGMENLFPVAGRRFSSAITPADLADYTHVVFDTSHFAVSGIDLFDAWNQLSDKVVHLHVSDNFGNGRDSHAPLGTGALPIAQFLEHVGRSGYRGTLTLELDVRPHMATRDTLIDFLRDERIKAEGFLAGQSLDDLELELSQP